MDEKAKSCFTGHVMMHSLFGLGLGLLLTALIPALGNFWFGVILIAIAMIADKMRK